MRVLVLVLLLGAAVMAKPMMVDLVDVPVSRLLPTLEKRAQKNPKDARAWFLLARIRGIAYARGAAAAVGVERKNPDQPWFGPFDAGFPPPEPVKKPAKEYLKGALEAYRRSMELDKSYLPARLGYAWCLEEAGRKSEAIEQYRWILKNFQVGETLFNRTVGEEAGARLIALLDPARDKAEIARVKKQVETWERVPRAVTPMLVPLGEAEFEQLIDRTSAVRFDLDGSGRPLQWGWITPRAGWLVYRDRRATIESGLQMFGSVSWWLFWENGYEALSALDEDQDGWLRGRELEGIEVWNDRDGDGGSTPEELLSLDSLAIEALACQGRRHEHGWHNPQGIRYRDGRLGPSYDWVPAGPTPGLSAPTP